MALAIISKSSKALGSIGQRCEMPLSAGWRARKVTSAWRLIIIINLSLAGVAWQEQRAELEAASAETLASLISRAERRSDMREIAGRNVPNAHASEIGEAASSAIPGPGASAGPQKLTAAFVGAKSTRQSLKPASVSTIEIGADRRRRRSGGRPRRRSGGNQSRLLAPAESISLGRCESAPIRRSVEISRKSANNRASRAKSPTPRRRVDVIGSSPLWLARQQRNARSSALPEAAASARSAK